jgi:hypothetical protein
MPTPNKKTEAGETAPNAKKTGKGKKKAGA